MWLLFFFPSNFLLMIFVIRRQSLYCQHKHAEPVLLEKICNRREGTVNWPCRKVDLVEYGVLFSPLVKRCISNSEKRTASHGGCLAFLLTNDSEESRNLNISPDEHGRWNIEDEKRVSIEILLVSCQVIAPKESSTERAKNKKMPKLITYKRGRSAPEAEKRHQMMPAGVGAASSIWPHFSSGSSPVRGRRNTRVTPGAT